MIYKTLHIISRKFNQYLSSKFALEERSVVLSQPVTSGNSLTVQQTNKLIVSLVNIERDTTAGIHFKTWSDEKKQHFSGRPPLSLNLFILVSASFNDKNYDESLRYLSSALEFIQSNNLLTSNNTPELNPEISKLYLELVNISFHELSNIWGMQGCHYSPSFLIKVKMLTFDQMEIKSQQKVSERTSLNLS